MLRHLRNTTPADLAATHTRLAEFFAASQKGLDLQGRTAYDSESWRKFECEHVYHSVRAQPDRNVSVAINAFQHAFRWRWGFSESIAQICRQVGHETSSKTTQDIAIALSEIYMAYEQENWQVGIERLKPLEGQAGLTQTAHCEIHALRGMMYRSIQEYDKALQDLNRAIGLDEEYAWAIASRGETYRQMGQYESALTDLNCAIQLDEKDAWAIASRGKTYRRLGQHDDAIRDFMAVLEIEPQDSFPLSRRAATYLVTGNAQAAQADLEQIMALPLKDASDFYNRAVTLTLLGQHTEAIEMLKQAFERDTAEQVYAQTDDLLDPIRNLPEFQELFETK